MMVYGLFVNGKNEVIVSGASTTKCWYGCEETTDFFYTVKLDPSGNVLWEQTYCDPREGTQAADAEVDADGNIYVIGSFNLREEDDTGCGC